jgi:hypothetical protein
VRCSIFCLEVEIDSPDMWGMWAIEVEIEGHVGHRGGDRGTTVRTT